jgi:hypothetical protein
VIVFDEGGVDNASSTRTMNIAKQHGTIILSPQDAAVMLPAYPGFGLLRGERAKA